MHRQKMGQTTTSSNVNLRLSKVRADLGGALVLGKIEGCKRGHGYSHRDGRDAETYNLPVFPTVRAAALTGRRPELTLATATQTLEACHESFCNLSRIPCKCGIQYCTSKQEYCEWAAVGTFTAFGAFLGVLCTSNDSETIRPLIHPRIRFTCTVEGSARTSKGNRQLHVRLERKNIMTSTDYGL